MKKNWKPTSTFKGYPKAKEVEHEDSNSDNDFVEQLGQLTTKEPITFHQIFREALLCYQDAKGDIEKYNQLRFKHSKAITGFRSNSSCWDCFIQQHDLDRETVKNLYTRHSLFKDVNLALCNEEKSIKELKMFTQLLSEALFQRVERLPAKVYRGVHFSPALARLYEQSIGQTIYYYNFTSTSRLLAVAQEFGTWVLEITLQQGNRDCVADVSGISAFPNEQEILIACNSGFRIDAVSFRTKRIYLTLVDQSKCLRQRPAKSCAAHA